MGIKQHFYEDGTVIDMAFKIVVGYDGSDGAKAALDKAVDLAGRLSSEVLLTCAYGGPEAYSAEPLTLRHTLQEAGETLISDAMARSANSGVSIEPLLVDLDRESAAQGLLSVARQRRAEMIVVGAHGQSPIAAMLLGSTTYKLLHITSKPLLVVPAAQGSPTSELPSKIVVGYDGSDGAKAALDAAVGLAGRLSGKVLVIHGYGGPGSSGCLWRSSNSARSCSPTRWRAAGGAAWQSSPCSSMPVQPRACWAWRAGDAPR